MGSNTAGVISKSVVPVLAIPIRHRFKKIETIVYACDLKHTLEELTTLTFFEKHFDASI